MIWSLIISFIETHCGRCGEEDELKKKKKKSTPIKYSLPVAKPFNLDYINNCQCIK